MSAENPMYAKITPLRIGGRTRFDWRHPKAGDFNSATMAAVDAERLVNYLLCEEWHQHAEIVPNYVARYAKEGARPEVHVRVPMHSDNEHHEAETHSYLRFSKGPKQGFFWDCYGDDFGTIELAILALHQAPPPMYCGPLVFKIGS